MLHSTVISDYHHEIDRLTSKLQAPTAASNGDRSRRAPAVFSAAGRYAFAVIAPEADGNFHHRRYDGNALRVRHNLVWNRLVWRAHNLVQNIRGFLDPLFDVRCVFGPTRARHDQHRHGQYGNAGSQSFLRLHCTASREFFGWYSFLPLLKVSSPRPAGHPVLPVNSTPG